MLTRFGSFSTIAAVLVLGFALRGLTCSTEPYLHDWDERYHALVAKQIAQSGEWWAPKLYRDPVLAFPADDWAHSHVWLHKQPLTCWIMAGSLRLFGYSALVVRLPAILFSTLSIWLVFVLGRRLFNRRVGLVAAGLSAVHGLTLKLSSGKVPTDHVDVYFAFFILLALYLLLAPAKQKQPLRLLLAGLAMGAAILVKWLPALIVLPVYFALHPERRKWWPRCGEVLLIFLASIPIWLPWQLYILSTYPEQATVAYGHNLRHITEALDGYTNGPFFFLDKLHYNFGEVSLLAIIAGLFTLRRMDGKIAALLTWTLVPILFFSLVKTRMQGYIFFCAPAIFLLSAWLIDGLLDRRTPENPSRSKWLTAAVVLLFVSPLIRCYESLQLGRLPTPEFVQERTAQHPDWNERTLVFGSAHPINDMFFNEIAASYEFVPDSATLERLSADYTLVVQGQ